MKSNVAGLAAALALSAGCIASAYAGAKIVEPRAGAAARQGAVSSLDALRAADVLVRYGDANKDALALITAAKIMKEVGSSEWRAPRTTSGAAAKPTSAGDANSITAILQRAKTYADGRQDFVALADDIATSGSRGGMTGPQVGRFVAAPGATDQYKILFEGGQPAQVAVSGDGTSTLELAVYNQDGKLVCRDAQYGDQRYCLWLAPVSETYVVKVTNPGKLPDEYLIRRN